MDKKEEMRYGMAVLFVVVSVMFIVFLLPFDGITGSAVDVDKIVVKKQLGKLISKFPLINYAENADLCFVIKMDEFTAYSYSVVKKGKSVEITDTKLYCDGENEEDFIIGYIDYASFTDHAEEMSCEKFKSGNTKSFYFFLSKFVKAGGDIACTPEFRDKYCVSLNYCMTPAEMKAAGMGCCFDLATEQKELALKAAREGVLADERSSSPELSTPGLFGTTTLLILIGALVVLVLAGGGAFYLLETHKRAVQAPKTTDDILTGVPQDQIEEVRVYIASCADQGFTREQIRQALIESGWSSDKAEHFVKKFFAVKQPPQGP